MISLRKCYPVSFSSSQFLNRETWIDSALVASILDETKHPRGNMFEPRKARKMIEWNDELLVASTWRPNRLPSPLQNQHSWEFHAVAASGRSSVATTEDHATKGREPTIQSGKGLWMHNQPDFQSQEHDSIDQEE